MDTKQQILDAAEALFSREGYHAASMRAITESAGVNLASANYHFGSKEALLEAVVERRLKPINTIRQKRLREIRENSRLKGERPSVREILGAFIGPALRFRVGTGGTNFTLLASRAFVDPDGTVQKIFLRLMKPVSQLMVEMLGDALPGFSKEAVFWRYQFVIGAFSRAVRMYTDPEYGSLKRTAEIDIELLTDLLVSFAAAGMGAPAKTGETVS